MSASVVPTITTFWLSQLVDAAIAPRRRPNPRTNPMPAVPVAWWRSTTQILAMSFAGSATTAPSTTSSATCRARL